jgi:hypothetical protein
VEIKRRLNAAAKCMTPEIEAMNTAIELKMLLDRVEGLIRYAEGKIANRAARAKAKEKTIGQKARDQQAADQKIIIDYQTEESDANLADQREAFEERNAKLRDKGQPEMESDPLGAEGDAKDQLGLKIPKPQEKEDQ